jgi:hypothetical protein
MRHHLVSYSPEAKSDLLELYNHLCDVASVAVEFHNTGRIERYIAGFDIASERGTARPEIRQGSCTKEGCVPMLLQSDTLTENARQCPCCGTFYDAIGRVGKGIAKQNLYVPAYAQSGILTLRLGTV